MKSKMIIGICAILAIALISGVYVFNINKDKDADSNLNEEYSGNGSFSEIRYDQDKLINESGLIVRCIFTGEKETKNITSLTKNSKGEDTEFEAPFTTYKMKTVERLKGSVEDEFEFGLIGTGDRNFKKDGEYVLFLNYNRHNKTYKLVSYSQGFNKVKPKGTNAEKNDVQSTADQTVSKDETIEIESVDLSEVMDYKELKSKIKELEK